MGNGFKINVGMSQQDVINAATQMGLSKKQISKINRYFFYDKDKKVSNGNEVAIFNAIFDGSDKVKMPTEHVDQFHQHVPGIVPPIATECSQKNPDGSTTYTILHDINRDGVADFMNISNVQKSGDNVF